MRSLRARLLSPGGLAAIFVGLLPLVYFFPALLGRIILAPDDALIFGLPLRVAAAQMMREGHLPLWNPYLFGGMPLFASAQAGLLFPLNWFFLICGPRAAMNIAILASYSLAGVGTYLFARRSGHSICGSLVSALVWQWCGFLIAQIGHTNIIHVAALLPWLFWAMEGYGQTGRRGRGATLAVIVALQVFAGHQQTLVYSLLLAGSYAVVLAFSQIDPLRRRRYLFSLSLIASGLLLAAVQILPTLELARESLRSQASYEFFTSFSLPPVFLLTFFAPYLVGGGDGYLFRVPYLSEAFYGEYIGYVGLIALLLAILAPLVRPDRTTKFWAWAALVALGLTLGRFWIFDLYRLVYHIPVLNLFRVPARHMMEVDFALALLAGRAVTFLPQMPRSGRRLVLVLLSGLGLLLLTWAAVTILRPANFRLGRLGPVSILRAPELFLPLVLSTLSIWAVVRFVRGQRFAQLGLVSLLFADLALWGQFSGWRVGSPRPNAAIFKTPSLVKSLHRSEGTAPGKYRVLTLDQQFAEVVNGTAPQTSPAFDIALQPDFYMMHRIENAAGYDGFGLARYSRLAGEMKIWGAFPDPARSIFESRVLDLLNVRYLITPARQAGALEILPAKTKLGPFQFNDHDLGLPLLEGGMRFDFETPPVAASRLAFVSYLAWSADLPDGTTAAVVTLRAKDGRSWRFDLRVGIDSSEWAYDRPDIRAAIRHSRAPIASSSRAQANGTEYDAHSFVSSFELPEKAVIVSGSIETARIKEAPNFGLSLLRVSLIDQANNLAVPLRKEWLGNKVTAAASDAANGAGGWVKWKQAAGLALYRNEEALPRVWLASETRALGDAEKLAVIRTGKLSDGAAWDPRRTALLDTDLPAVPPAASPNESRAEIVRYTPNQVEIATTSATASLLVLGDNHYPGWSASVDGRSAPLLRADYNLRAVQLDGGTHTVRFSYRPKSVLYGMIVSLLSAGALAGWCAFLPRAKVS